MWSKKYYSLFAAHKNPFHQRWSSMIIAETHWSSMISDPLTPCTSNNNFQFLFQLLFWIFNLYFYVIDASSMHHRCGQSENYNDDRRIDEALHHRWSSIMDLTDDDTMIKYLMGYIIDASALSSIAHRWSSLRHYDHRWPVIDDLKSSMIIDDHRFKLKP